MSLDKSAKILVLGKSGVGKSSFINYFLGSDKAEVGDGRPITKGYCKEYEYHTGKFPIKIYDNQGFEAAIANEQKDEILNFVAEHNNSDNVFNWFHTIFYCTSAYLRFEDFEAEFLLDLSRTISQNVHIILTTCDGFTSEELEEKKKHIRNKLEVLGDKCHIFEVVSVNMKKRNGDVVEQRGKEAISASVFRLLWEDICSKIAKDYAKELCMSMIDVLKKSHKKINKMINKITSIGGLKKLVSDDSFLDNLSNDIDEEIERSIDECNSRYDQILQPICELYCSYCQIVTAIPSISGLSMLDFQSMLPTFDFDEDDELSKCFPSLSRIIDTEFEDITFRNFFDILGGLGEIVTARPRLLIAIDKIFKEYCKKLPSKEQIEEIACKRLMTFLDSFCLDERTL